MLVREFTRRLQEVLPPETAMSGDAIGLQVAPKRPDIGRVSVCLEITDQVVDEARSAGHDAIVTFHPLIYSPLRSIDRSDRVGRIVADCIAADIAVYSVHTAFDAYQHGTNLLLCAALGCNPVGPLVPNGDGQSGMGLIASCDVSYETFVQTVADVCGGPVRYSTPPRTNVSRIAIVAGSGMSFYNDALVAGVDVFVTADVKYHAFHAAAGHIGLVDPGHFEMEQFVPAGLTELLRQQIPSVDFTVSNVRTMPAAYALPSSFRSQTFLIQS